MSRTALFFLSIFLIYAIGVGAGSFPLGSVWPRFTQMETSNPFQFQDRWSMEIDGQFLGESEMLAGQIRDQFGFDESSHITAWRYGLGDNECECEGFLFVVTPMDPVPSVSLDELANEFYQFQLSLGYESVLPPTLVETSTNEMGYEWILSFGLTGQREFLFSDPNGFVVRLVVVDLEGITDKSFINQAIDSFTRIESFSLV